MLIHLKPYQPLNQYLAKGIPVKCAYINGEPNSDVKYLGYASTSANPVSAGYPLDAIFLMDSDLRLIKALEYTSADPNLLYQFFVFEIDNSFEVNEAIVQFTTITDGSFTPFYNEGTDTLHIDNTLGYPMKLYKDGEFVRNVPQGTMDITPQKGSEYYVAVELQYSELFEFVSDTVTIPNTEEPEPETLTVTFESNGGSAVASQSVEYGKKVIRPTNPSRSGFSFAGWYTEADLKNLYDFNSAVTESFTLYAGWEQTEDTDPTKPGTDPSDPDTSEKKFNKIKSCVFTFRQFRQDIDVDFTSALNLPIVYNPVLDETLDTAQIVLTDLRAKDYPKVDVTTAFEAFTRVTIKFVDQETEIKMLLAHDDCKLQRKDDTPWKSYRHTIQLIELTKELERASLDTLTFNNPIPRNYDAEADTSWSFSEE